MTEADGTSSDKGPLGSGSTSIISAVLGLKYVYFRIDIFLALNKILSTTVAYFCQAFTLAD